MQRGMLAARISQRVLLKMGSGTPGLVVHSVSQYPKIVSEREMRPLPMATDFNGTWGWCGCKLFWLTISAPRVGM
jgi:hypothetical protein